MQGSFRHRRLAASVALIATTAVALLDPRSPLTGRTRAAEPGISLGRFTGSNDVGACARKGSARFDDATGTYTITGSGANMWSTNDALHFVWAPAQGDLVLSARVVIQTPDGDPHRKACLLVRQSLDADSAYADAVVHGDGLTSLQYRETAGARTYEIQTDATAPRWLRLEKTGRYLSMSHSADGRNWTPAGGSFRLDLRDPFYVGLGVCAHDNTALVTAEFSEVRLATHRPAPAPQPVLHSTLETVSLASRDRRAVWTTTNHIEAPNWSRDGSHLVVNGGGRLLRLPVGGGTPQAIETGFATRCNNDHGFSPDGTELAISDQTEERHSLIYLLPASGGTPRRITRLGPSYWHGWSPDGKTLAYCAERNGEYDVYTIPVQGGDETRLTTAKGLDDGPEYSPDGRFIYFNTDRTGTMEIWRMRPDGSDQEPVVADAFHNWFPHPSPDGRWIVFLSYEPGVQGHPPNQDVTLRLVPTAGGKPEILAKLYGGQGTLNVPSWSPDSRRLAFVSYHWR